MQRVPVAHLTPAPWNPRMLRDARFKSLCASLQADPEFLELRPILATTDGTVYGGNQRLRAALHLGWQDVPAILSDIPERLARERALKDNNNWGEWQEDDLAALVYDLGQNGADLDALGFEPKELTRLLDSVGALGESDDAIPEPPADPITRPGDLWLLGPHRLLCGDATRPEDVRQLMGGQRAALGLCDPPYNVGEDYSQHEDRLSPEEYAVFTRQWFDLLSRHSERQIITPGFNNIWLYMRSFDAPKHVAPWTKTNSMTRGGVSRFACWEPVLFYGDEWGRERPNDVFDFPISDQHVAGMGSLTGLHPCPKPLGFWADIVQHYTPAGGLVVDFFGGTGTTIAAAHQAGRVGYCLEIDPAYADVIVQRYERLTGETATREAAGVAA